MACTYASAQILLAFITWHVFVFAYCMYFIKYMALVCSSTHHVVVCEMSQLHDAHV